MSSGTFSPIEDVIADAERLAEAEWRREHEPCQHRFLFQLVSRQWPTCSECGADVPDA